MGRSIDYIHLGEDEMISLNADYLKPVIDHAEKTQIVDEDVPPVQSVFDLKSGARAKLVDRSGSMVIVEVEKYRSDWIEWTEVKARMRGSDT
jgi:hypothetical protein